MVSCAIPAEGQALSGPLHGRFLLGDSPDGSHSCFPTSVPSPRPGLPASLFSWHGESGPSTASPGSVVTGVVKRLADLLTSVFLGADIG